MERARQLWPERVGKESGAGGPSLFAAKQEKALSSFFPPKLPIPSAARIYREKSRGHEAPHPRSKRSVYGFFVLSMEIVS